MAVDPAFAATPLLGAGLVPATADTSQTAPTNFTSLFTAGANGTKVEEIDVIPVGTVVAGIVNVFLHDGTTFHLFDQFAITAYTLSTTAVGPRQPRTYTNLWLPSNSWTMRVTNTVAGNVSLLKVLAFGGNL